MSALSVLQAQPDHKVMLAQLDPQVRRAQQDQPEPQVLRLCGTSLVPTTLAHPTQLVILPHTKVKLGIESMPTVEILATRQQRERSGR